MDPYAPPLADQKLTPAADLARARYNLRAFAVGVGLVAGITFAGAAALALRDAALGVDAVSQGLSLLAMVGLGGFYALTSLALWRGWRAARALGFVCCALSACACPTGPLLSLWGLWVLTRPDVVALIRGQTSDGAPPAAPP
ncbi:hypothetical protein L6R49_18040 [Myxococcota bacterium]|nr:hypothetical protein [Myxococcota bacterium]